MAPLRADARWCAFGVLASLFLILQLQWKTWLRFVMWLVIGLVIHFTYGRKHSLLNPDSPLHARTPASGTQRSAPTVS